VQRAGSPSVPLRKYITVSQANVSGETLVIGLLLGNVLPINAYKTAHYTKQHKKSYKKLAPNMTVTSPTICPIGKIIAYPFLIPHVKKAKNTLL
jgi:hypothetical protein